MGELILLIISHLLSLIVGMKIGFTFIAEDLYSAGKIELSELKYMKSWKYFYDFIRSNN
jgi:hypothetical protein